jgi:hypothetical protein
VSLLGQQLDNITLYHALQLHMVSEQRAFVKPRQSDLHAAPKWLSHMTRECNDSATVSCMGCSAMCDGQPLTCTEGWDAQACVCTDGCDALLLFAAGLVCKPGSIAARKVRWLQQELL